MISPRVSKALNPQRRKLTLKQIKAGFGGKRRKASLKASPKRHAHKRRAKAVNPKKHKRRATAKARNATRAKVVYRTRTKVKYRTRKVLVKPKRRAKAKRSSNPGPYLLTMAPVGNPHRKKRRKASMAKTKRRASAKGRSGKRNPTRRRRAARRSNHRPRSRNPIGVSSSTVRGVVGAAVGFSIGKKVPPMFGPSMNSSPMMTLLSTALTAAAVAWAARKFAPSFADGALIGGGMAVVNVAWNAWAPASIQGYSALGDFTPGGFPLPQGPVRYVTSGAPSQTPTGSQVNVGAFGSAW